MSSRDYLPMITCPLFLLCSLDVQREIHSCWALVDIRTTMKTGRDESSLLRVSHVPPRFAGNLAEAIYQGFIKGRPGLADSNAVFCSLWKYTFCLSWKQWRRISWRVDTVGYTVSCLLNKWALISCLPFSRGMGFQQEKAISSHQSFFIDYIFSTALGLIFHRNI